MWGADASFAHFTGFELVLAGQDVTGGAMGDHSPRQHERVREMLFDQVLVMQCRDNGTPFLMPGVDDTHEIGDGFFVNRRERLVEENQVGILQQ